MVEPVQDQSARNDKPHEDDEWPAELAEQEAQIPDMDPEPVRSAHRPSYSSVRTQELNSARALEEIGDADLIGPVLEISQVEPARLDAEDADVGSPTREPTQSSRIPAFVTRGLRNWTPAEWRDRPSR
jgi:hypothetical protein